MNNFIHFPSIIHVHTHEQNSLCKNKKLRVIHHVIILYKSESYHLAASHQIPVIKTELDLYLNTEGQRG